MSKKEYALDSLFEDIPKEDYNENWCAYNERFHELLKKGLPGFIIGAIIFLALAIYLMVSSTEKFDPSAIIALVLFPLVGGYALAGIPYGWSVINKYLGQWTIFGNIFVIIFLFLLKFAVAYGIGLVAYPIVLIYNLIRSQKSRRKVRLWTIIVISVVVLWNIFLGIYAIIDARVNPREDNLDSTTSSSVKHYATADEIPMDIAKQIADQLVSEKQNENDSDPNFNYTDVELYGIFFLEGKEDAWGDENQLHFVIHYNMLNNNGEVQNACYTPMYIKDILVQADGSISLQRDDCVSLFFYDSAEAYTDKYEGDYNITKIG